MPTTTNPESADEPEGLTFSEQWEIEVDSGLPPFDVTDPAFLAWLEG